MVSAIVTLVMASGEKECFIPRALLQEDIASLRCFYTSGVFYFPYQELNIELHRTYLHYMLLK